MISMSFSGGATSAVPTSSTACPKRWAMWLDSHHVGDHDVSSPSRYLAGSFSGTAVEVIPRTGAITPSLGRWRLTFRPHTFGMPPPRRRSFIGTASSTVQPPSNLPVLALMPAFQSPAVLP